MFLPNPDIARIVAARTPGPSQKRFLIRNTFKRIIITLI
jgi:hypothetical protein